MSDLPPYVPGRPAAAPSQPPPSPLEPATGPTPGQRPGGPLTRRWPLIVGAVCLVAAVAIGGGALGAQLAGQDDDASTPGDVVRVGGDCDIDGQMSETVAGAPVRCEDGGWARLGPAERAVRTPALSEFELAVRVTSKQCFGSAGCIVEIAIDLSMIRPPADGPTWALTYEVTGGEDGPLVDTMEISGDEYTVMEHQIDTATKSVELKVEPTHIERVA